MAQGSSRTTSQDERRKDTSESEDERLIGAEFAKALQELARGEQTATTLENRLSDIESKIEQLLASAEENARHTAEMKKNGNNKELEGKADPNPNSG